MPSDWLRMISDDGIIYFTKSILFASKRKIKKLQKLEIIYNNIQIKQHSQVAYLGCIIEETMSRELMANKVISEVNVRLKF